MTLSDPLANALTAVTNAEARSKDSVVVRPASTIIKNVLKVLKDEAYITDFELIDDRRGGLIRIQLKGAINRTGAIKPRYSIKIDEFERFEKRYLPAKGFGRIIVSTPQGVMTHLESKKKALGGVLLAYVY